MIPNWSPTYLKPGLHMRTMIADLSQTWGIQYQTTPTAEKVCFHVKICFIFVWDWSATVGKVEPSSTFLIPACLGYRRFLPHKVRPKCFHMLRNCPRLGQRLVWDIVTDYSGYVETRRSENKKFTPKGEGGSGRQASTTENT